MADLLLITARGAANEALKVNEWIDWSLLSATQPPTVSEYHHNTDAIHTAVVAALGHS